MKTNPKQLILVKISQNQNCLDQEEAPFISAATCRSSFPVRWHSTDRLPFWPKRHLCASIGLVLHLLLPFSPGFFPFYFIDGRPIQRTIYACPSTSPFPHIAAFTPTYGIANSRPGWSSSSAHKPISESHSPRKTCSTKTTTSTWSR